MTILSKYRLTYITEPKYIWIDGWNKYLDKIWKMSKFIVDSECRHIYLDNL